MSQALIDLDISHEAFKTTVNEKENYEQMKESIRNIKSRAELSENSRDIRDNSEKYTFLKKNTFLFVYIKWLKLVLRHGKNVVLKQLFLTNLQKIKKNYG